MTKRIPLEGLTFGKLHIEQYTGGGKYLCTCSCGNQVLVLGSNLRSGHTTSCGCSKFTSNLAGQVFGYLKVLERAGGKVRGGAKRPVWKCECLNCGAITDVYADSLISGNTTSCGCLAGQRQREMPEAIKAGFVNGTQLSKIKSKPTAANKSGVVGVNWDKSRGKWQASIKLQGKKYNLGRFEDFEEAAKVRKRAEERLFRPILDLQNDNALI